MEDYIVSARKYRPMSWQAVVGQEALTTTLKNAIRSGRLAHAYLFCGPRGVGKTTSARIFARTINCLNPTADFEACGECESCRAFNEGRSFNIHELDAASNNSVDDIRLLTEQVQIPPQVGKYKVFIIDEVHMLSSAAFNAFLKTLEEPPAHVIFILATTEKHKILPTILSRCQIFDFNRMTVADTVAHLQMVAEKEGYTAEPEALAVIAQKADGGMRDALSIFDQVAGYTQGTITYAKVIENLNVLDYDYYFKMVDLLLDKKIAESMVLLNEVLNKGFDAGHFVGGMATHLRNVMMSRDAQTLPLLQCSEQVRERYRQQAQRCSERFIYRALKLCNNCDINYRVSRNKRLLVEVTMVQVSGADEDPAGRRPAKSLPHIFELQVPRAQAAQTASNEEAGMAAAQSPASDVKTEVAAVPSSATPAVQSDAAQAAPRPSATARRLGGLSIRSMSGGVGTDNAPKPSADSVAAQPVAPQEETPGKELDETLLRQLWTGFAVSLPQEDIALKPRMLAMKVTLLSPTSFEALAPNPMVASDLQSYRSRIEAHFAANLGGLRPTMEVRVEEVKMEEVMTRPMMIREMTEHSRAVARLRQILQLEII